MHTDDRGWLDRLRDQVDQIRRNPALWFRQRWQDNFAALEKQEKGVGGGELLPAHISPSISARFAKNWHSTLEVALNQAQVRYDPNSPAGITTIEGSKPLRAIYAQLGKDPATARAFAMWSIVKRAERLMAEGREHNVPQEMIDRYRNLSDQFGGLFERVHADLQAWHRNLLDFGEQAGIINHDSRQLWEHDDYVPFYRALDPEGVAGPNPGGRGIVNARSPIRQLFGGEQKINNVYENTVMNAAAMIRRGMANIAARKARDMLVTSTDALTPMSKVARVPYEDPAMQQMLRDAGLDPAQLTEAAKQGARDLFTALRRREPDVVSVMDNGKPTFYRVNDPWLLESLTAAGPQTLTGLSSLLAAPARLLRSAVVFDPAFALAHNLRMGLHAWLLTGTSPFASFGQALRQARGLDPTALKMMAAGVSGGRYDVDLPAEVRRQISTPEYQNSLIDTPAKAFRFLRHVGESMMQASDMGPRIAVYQHALAQGMSEAEAMNRARDLLDFSTHGNGQVAMFLAQTIPFLNARWQGLARTYRGFTGTDRNGMFMRGMLMTAATLALWAQNKDDPEYQRLPDWDRQYAWHVKVGDQWFRIPKPFELGALFGSLPEMLAEYHENGSVRQLNNALLSLVGNVWKFNPIPVAIRPVMETWFNHDMYTGQPIVNEGEAGLTPDMQYGATTSQSVVALTQAVNRISPIQFAPADVQHLLQGYLAGWGSYVSLASDWLSEQYGLLPSAAAPAEMPVVGRFMREEPNPSNRFMGDLYDMRAQIGAIGRTVRKAEETQNAELASHLMAEHPEYSRGLERQLNNVGTRLSHLGGLYQKIQMNPNLSADAKTAARDRYYQQRDRILDQIRPLLRQAEGLPATP